MDVLQRSSHAHWFTTRSLNNKSPSLKWRVKCYSKWEQASSQQFCHFWCQKRKKPWEQGWVETQFLTETKTFIKSEKFTRWKTILNPRTLDCFANSPATTFMPSISSSKVSEQFTQAGWLCPIFFGKRKHLATGNTLFVSQVEMRKKRWIPEAEECEGDL